MSIGFDGIGWISTESPDRSSRILKRRRGSSDFHTTLTYPAENWKVVFLFSSFFFLAPQSDSLFCPILGEGRNDSVEENYTGEEATMAMTKAARDHDDLANLTNVQPHAPHALIFYLNTQ